jgi:ubiquinone/menaquinone biosynthesis C-methylase UbiE
MDLHEKAREKETRKMSDTSFKLMSLAFNAIDFLFPYIDRRIKNFEVREGMVVVDYGCGPGRYTTRFARLVGETGKVYAVDIHKLAIETVKGKIEKYRLQNVVPVLARGYDSALPEHVADMVCAIDMFFSIERPTELLGELRRIAKKDGLLIIDDGHQSRATTKKKILESGYWNIWEETPDHLKCKPSCLIM